MAANNLPEGRRILVHAKCKDTYTLLHLLLQLTPLRAQHAFWPGHPPKGKHSAKGARGLIAALSALSLNVWNRCFLNKEQPHSKKLP